MKFSASNANFSSSSADPLSSRKPAHSSDKRGTPRQSGYFADNGSSSVKTVADGLKHAAFHNKQRWRHFSGISIDDFDIKHTK